MPIDCQIELSEKRIYTTCSGMMQTSDFDAYLAAVWSDMKCYGFNELFDTTRGDWSNFDFGYLLTLAEKAADLKTIDTNTRLAWVILDGKQKELTDFYLAAKTMLPARSRELRAFYSRDEALEWLS